MSDATELDHRLRMFFAEQDAPPPDPQFADRIVALAAHELRARHARRRAMAQVAREGLALAAVLLSFALLARHGPAAGFGDAVPAGSPALLGMAMLLIWTLVGGRGAIAPLR